MTLEDHLGDIVRKARKATNMSSAEAAAAAGMTEDQLTTLERSGTSLHGMNLTSLAHRIGLDADKLSAIARGWHPAEQDLSRWRELRRIKTEQGGNAVNCFLVWDEVTREAALFDTGWDA